MLLRHGLALVHRAARASGNAVAALPPLRADIAPLGISSRHFSCLGPPPPVMDDYCASASPLSSAAEYHAITGASSRESGDMEQLVPPKPCCIGFMSWSSPECRRFGPVFDELTRHFPHVRFYKVDVESEEAAKLALEQNVGPDRQLPVFKMFRDGIESRPEVEGARRDKLMTALQRLVT